MNIRLCEQRVGKFAESLIIKEADVRTDSQTFAFLNERLCLPSPLATTEVLHGVKTSMRAHIVSELVSVRHIRQKLGHALRPTPQTL